MENFWIRYKNTELDCACLEEEKINLKKENEQLKDQLRKYLQNMSLTNGRVGSTKERLRPHSMKIEKLAQINVDAPKCAVQVKQNLSQRPVTGIEGNLSAAIRSHQLTQRRIKPCSIYSVVN